MSLYYRDTIHIFCCGYLCQSCGFLPKNSLSYYDPSVKNHCGQSDEDYLNGCHILRVDTKQINHRLYVEDKIESKRNAFFSQIIFLELLFLRMLKYLKAIIKPHNVDYHCVESMRSVGENPFHHAD